jgi:tRNA pseudouridine38-40 synthase
VQGAIEQALSSIANHAVATVAAGRTDAGVHAYGQVVHFDSPAKRSAYAWLLGSNTQLPSDISLRWIQPVTADFDARFSAIRRSYRYVIHNHRSRSALLSDLTGWLTPTLDAEAMHRAAQALAGKHDFSAFRASECQSKTAIRTMESLSVWRRGDFVVLDIVGNAFLHHMVRNIVGVLMEIGQGKRAEAWSAEVLASRDRRLGGITAPAAGLYFIGPEYPAQFELPTPAQAWFPA